jgi:hypothetical protein
MASGSTSRIPSGSTVPFTPKPRKTSRSHYGLSDKDLKQVCCSSHCIVSIDESITDGGHASLSEKSTARYYTGGNEFFRRCIVGGKT